MNILKNIWKKATVCFLVICMLFSTNIGFAAVTAPNDEIISPEPVRGAEIQSLRETNSKTYEMSDGSYQCVIYADDVHYEASDGALKEIDNAITNTAAKNGYSYTNSENSWHTYFADKLSQNNAVTLEKGNYSISFSLLNQQELSGEISLDQPVLSAENNTANAIVAANMTASEIAANPVYEALAEDNRVILYRDVLTDVDISYTVKAGALKEDIILKSAAAPNKFMFKFNTEGLTPKETDGKIVFDNSDGETVFELVPMYMEDANGKYSEKIEYSVEQDTDGYLLTVTADPDFLQDSTTVYPVMIDPSVMVTGESKTYDTCVDQQYPSSNYYLKENLWTGGALGTNAMRTFIKFDLPTNINASQITSAYLRIKKREHATPKIKAYRITNSWNSSTVTWNKQPGFTTSGATGTIALDSGAWYKINATTMVKNWRSGAYSNYGFVLKEPTESSSSQKTKFYSSDAPSPNKPELVINYTDKRYSFNVVHYYDQGYQIRFSNASSAINGHQSAVTNILEQLFTLKINSSYVSYTSNADDCKIQTSKKVTSENLTASCGHSPNHLTMENLRNALISDKGKGTSTTSLVLWTGHIMPGNPSSNAVSASHIVIMTPKQTTNSSTYQNLASGTVNKESRFDLLHELSHQLDAPDHYCYGVPAGKSSCSNKNCCKCNGKTTPICVMTSRKNIETTNINSLYCSACKSTISSHLAGHH